MDSRKKTARGNITRSFIIHGVTTMATTGLDLPGLVKLFIGRSTSPRYPIGPFALEALLHEVNSVFHAYLENALHAGSGRPGELLSTRRKERFKSGRGSLNQHFQGTVAGIPKGVDGALGKKHSTTWRHLGPAIHKKLRTSFQDEEPLIFVLMVMRR